MKDAIIAVVLVVTIFISFVVQALIPPLDFASGSRVFLMPVLFCAGACILPFYYMLVLAIFSGLIADLLWLQPVGDSVEISVGWTILLLVAIGSICQGVRPLVLRGQWWWPALFSGGTTFAILLSQFLAITMRRFDSGGFIWNETVTTRMLVPAAIAMVLSLVLHLAWEFFSHGLSGRRSLREF